jgi:hypothetical protein
LDKEFRHRVWDVILLQPTQPTSAKVFQLSKRIEMNMVEERVVTPGFNKKIQGIFLGQ